MGGRGKLYTYRYAVTTRMTSAFRWAAMRAILMFHDCEGQSHKTVSTDHNFWRERRAEADSTRGPSAYQPNALPLGQTCSQSGGNWDLSGWALRAQLPANTSVCLSTSHTVSEVKGMKKFRPLVLGPKVRRHAALQPWCPVWRLISVKRQNY